MSPWGFCHGEERWVFLTCPSPTIMHLTTCKACKKHCHHTLGSQQTLERGLTTTARSEVDPPKADGQPGLSSGWALTVTSVFLRNLVKQLSVCQEKLLLPLSAPYRQRPLTKGIQFPTLAPGLLGLHPPSRYLTHGPVCFPKHTHHTSLIPSE